MERHRTYLDHRREHRLILRTDDHVDRRGQIVIERAREAFPDGRSLVGVERAGGRPALNDRSAEEATRR